jgi:hypothetical protein
MSSQAAIGKKARHSTNGVLRHWCRRGIRVEKRCLDRTEGSKIRALQHHEGLRTEMARSEERRL